MLAAPAKSPLSVGSDRFPGRPPGARGSSQFPVVRSRAFSFTATANRMSSFPSLYFKAYNTFATISAAFAVIGAIACRRSNSNEMYVPAPGPAPMARLSAGSCRLQIGHGRRGDPDAIDVRSVPNVRGIEGERYSPGGASAKARRCSHVASRRKVQRPQNASHGVLPAVPDVGSRLRRVTGRAFYRSSGDRVPMRLL